MSALKDKRLKAFDKKLAITFWWLLKIDFKVAGSTSLAYLLCAVVQIVANLVSYYVTARISALLVLVVTSNGSGRDILPWFITLIVSSLIAYTLYRTMDLLHQYTYFRLSKWSTRTFYEQLCHIDMADFYNSDIRDEVNKIKSGAEWQIPNAGTRALSTLHSVLNTVSTIVTIGVVAWWLIPVFSILLIPVFIYESKMAKINWFIWDEQSDDKHVIGGLQHLLTQASQQFEIRALSAGMRLMDRIVGINTIFYARQEKEVGRYNWLAVVTLLLQIIREGFAQGWLILQVINKKMSLEQYFFYVGMIFRLDGAISGLFSTFAYMQDGLKYSTDYRNFLSRTPKLIDKENAVALTSSDSPSIEFVDATFTYPGASKPVFSNLNLEIKSGQKVALVGENGAGKSTIIKLLMRFYTLDSGALLVNGIDIRDLAIESWLEQVATLFQDFNHYPLPVSDNISISGADTTDSNIRRAAKLSGAADYINSLPNKYNTYLDPAFKNGVEPSGGLWQRIALARAFYRDSKMIILDEPTSAIDSKAEYDIFNNIYSEHDGKTSLIVSHRFSTVRKADRIIVLENGTIVEDGTHKQLLSKNSTYAEMFNKQAEGYR